MGRPSILATGSPPAHRGADRRLPVRHKPGRGRADDGAMQPQPLRHGRWRPRLAAGLVVFSLTACGGTALTIPRHSPSAVALRLLPTPPKQTAPPTPLPTPVPMSAAATRPPTPRPAPPVPHPAPRPMWSRGAAPRSAGAPSSPPATRGTRMSRTRLSIPTPARTSRASTPTSSSCTRISGPTRRTASPSSSLRGASRSSPSPSPRTAARVIPVRTRCRSTRLSRPARRACAGGQLRELPSL